MSAEDLGYRFILDASALRDYARGDSVAVGELVREAQIEDRLIGVPEVCLATALASIKYDGVEATQRDLLRVLPTLPNVRLLPLAVGSFESAEHLADVYLAELGLRLDLACAALEANEFASEQATPEGDDDMVFVLTAEPDVYDQLGDKTPPTLDLGQGW